ncbi:MAG: CDP-diacylglycerol--glycerol-3-phosphate 3-phosphatidyltransferase, partial [Christensenellaceae bacterium]|nr:CDP-diacylglycerol--glycerol-3-phosphate 3-phosphatidyltransferase [Christensenellaceae bacterium]
ADKLLVLSTMCMFVALKELPAYVFIIILCRELAVDGLRLVASTQDVVIAASNYGKYKTTLQMIALIFYFTNNAPFGTFPIKQIIMALALIMTIISGVDYFIKNKSALKGA